MVQTIQPVILSGGAGTRLWPLSRELYPKQLLKLVSGQTLIQETALRTSDPALFAAPLVVCNAEHRFVIDDQLQEVGIKPAGLLIEPIARNTAAAIAAVAVYARNQNPEQLLLIMPSDHMIKDSKAFLAAIAAAKPLAEAGRIVTFGITPDRPDTGYGYIRSGDKLEGTAGFAISSFVEKPDLATAQGYLAQGGYLWNGGIFCARADKLIAEFERFSPKVLEAAEAAVDQATQDLGFTRLADAPFRNSPSQPFDKAVMEQTSFGAVVPVSMGWSDIGTWLSLWHASPQDENNNALIGNVRSEDSSGCYVRSEKLLTTVIGARDMVVVVTDDAVLVAPRDRAAEVGKLVDKMKKDGLSQTRVHNVVYRPWGHYEMLSADTRFQVKRITVKPNGRLSLQKHMHRAEHWTVVAGTAQVTINDKVSLLGENESVYVPLGAVHRLENLGKLPVVLIEVQSGAYLGEDDIVRLEDAYAREALPKAV